MQTIEIYFDGFCPENFLKGKKVVMKLNQDDFWESEETGLQITIFPPYAAILRWRGKGKFRQSAEPGSNTLKSLIMTKAKEEEGKEIFPDEEKIIHNNLELERYLDEIYESKEEYLAKRCIETNTLFVLQEKDQ